MVLSHNHDCKISQEPREEELLFTYVFYLFFLLQENAVARFPSQYRDIFNEAKVKNRDRPLFSLLQCKNQKKFVGTIRIGDVCCVCICTVVQFMHCMNLFMGSNLLPESLLGRADTDIQDGRSVKNMDRLTFARFCNCLPEFVQWCVVCGVWCVVCGVQCGVW